MSKMRKIRKVFKSIPTIEGAGVHLRRAFGYDDVPMFDPFLLLDDFRSDNPDHYLKGFPWHPHRGIETITYMLDGEVDHGDSLGNEGTINPGEVQWMTAGSGIIHQEMPRGDTSGKMGGFQLWANLPASHKMTDPKYRDVKSSDIPEVTLEDGTQIRIICGQVGEVKGPVHDIVTQPSYLDITLPPDTEYIHPTPKGHTVFAYVIEGRGYFCHQKDPYSYDTRGRNYFDLDKNALDESGTLVLFDDGDQVSAITETDALRFLLISGKPIGEPVAWYGPIVMNTRDELRIAIQEFNNGTFIKHPRG